VLHDLRSEYEFLNKLDGADCWLHRCSMYLIFAGVEGVQAAA
jgi:hypothetical protein